MMRNIILKSLNYFLHEFFYRVVNLAQSLLLNASLDAFLIPNHDTHLLPISCEIFTYISIDRYIYIYISLYLYIERDIEIYISIYINKNISRCVKQILCG